MNRTALFVLTGLALAGCVNVVVVGGHDTSQERTLAAFDKVQASRGIDVSLRCGPSPSAFLIGAEDDVANTELAVEDGVLTVRRSSMIGGYHSNVHVDVTTPGPLVKLSAGSGSTLEAPACAITHDKLELAASSGATIHLAATVRRLLADTGSGATIRPIKGTRIDAADAEIDAGSGSTVRLCTVGKMEASASSGATITVESTSAGDSHTSFGGGFSLRKCE